MVKKIKIIFMGTPSFAAASLKSLLNSPHEICAVFTQPDKPVGRKQILTAPPVKELALDFGIPVYQPNSLKSPEIAELIGELAPEMIVVAAYGKILPENILGIPPLGCVNVHGSLLPKYRGAAPIQWAILNGDTVTGVTTMLMDAGIDTGRILETAEIPIHPDETSGELFDRLAILGSELLIHTIENFSDIIPISQNNNESSYAPMLSKQDSLVNWEDSAKNIHNKIRGLNPWPGSLTTMNGSPVKLWKSAVSDEKSDIAPGSIVRMDKILEISCGGGGILRILELQPAGKGRMPAEMYLRGIRGQLTISS